MRSALVRWRAQERCLSTVRNSWLTVFNCVWHSRYSITPGPVTSQMPPGFHMFDTGKRGECRVLGSTSKIRVLQNCRHSSLLRRHSWAGDGRGRL